MSPSINLFATAVSAVAIALLVTAAATDVRSRTIPNAVSIGVALLAPLAWWAFGASWSGVGWQLLNGALFFALAYALWVVGVWGGGDAKLMPAVALWAPPSANADVLTITAFAGLAATIAVLVAARLRRQEAPPSVPYGVAIACAGLVLIAQLNLNHSGPTVFS